jgi:hypothetical protein
VVLDPPNRETIDMTASWLLSVAAAIEAAIGLAKNKP